MVPPQLSHIDIHNRVVCQKKAREPMLLRDFTATINPSHFLFDSDTTNTTN